jgi:hypothetical protein
VSIRGNHFGAPCAFSEYSLSSHCHPFRCPLLPSLSNVLCPLSHVFLLCLHPMFPALCLCSLSPILCFLSHVSVPCLPSSVSSLTSQFLIFFPLSPVSRLCSLSSVLCTLSQVICFLSTILLSPTPNPQSTVPVSPFLLLYSTVPVLCSSLSSPLFHRLLSSVPCLS